MKKHERIHLLVLFIRWLLFSSTSYAQQIPRQQVLNHKLKFLHLNPAFPYGHPSQINQAFLVCIPVSHSERSAFYSNLIVAVRGKGHSEHLH